MARAVVLTRYLRGTPREDDFDLRELPDAPPGEGEALVRNVLVSVDPYMRGRMSGRRTYVPPFELGAPVEGGAIGRVLESRIDGLASGDWVLSQLGWRERGIVAAGGPVRRLDPTLAPPSAALGVLGMPGFTAWIGLAEIGRVEAGETMYVSGAAGSVGSAAAQLALHKGLRVIGSAGSPAKVEWLRSLGVEAFDYRTIEPREALTDGIDVYFDNVGGAQLQAALDALRPFGRVIACGAISRYNDERPEPGPGNLSVVVTKRLRLQGFIILDHWARLDEFLAEAAPLVAARKIDYRETVVEGIENAPQAFAGLFSGDNVGKMLVRVGPD